MKKLIIISFLFFLPCFVFSQENLLELREQLAKTTDDSLRAEISNTIAKYYYNNGQPDSAKIFYQKFLSIAEQRNDLSQKVRAHVSIGSACLYIPLPDSAEWHFQKVLEMGEAQDGTLFKKMMCIALVNLGINYGINRGRATEELDYYLKGLKKAKEYSFSEMATDVLWRISNVYLDQGNYGMAMENARAGLAEAEKYGDKGEIIEMKRLIGIIIGEKESTPEELKEGIRSLQECLDYYISENLRVNQSYLHFDLAGIYGKSHQPDSALYHAEKGYELSKKVQIGHAEVNAEVVYAKALIGVGKYKEAIRVLHDAEETYRSYPLISSKATIHDLLAKAYAGMGDYKNAYSHARDLEAAMDSSYTALNDEKILALQTQFETEKKEQENIFLKNKNEMVTFRSRLYGVIGLLLIASILAVAFFYYKLRIKNRQLEKLNASKNRLFATLAHDLKGPAMSFNNLTKKINYLIKKGDPEQLLELGEYFERSGNRVNRVLSNLLDWAVSQKDQFVNNPENIDIAAISENIINDLKYFSEPKKIKINNGIKKEHIAYCDENAFSIIIRNLLHNAIKYSFPDNQINLRSYKKGNNIAIEIQDYGVGMDGRLIKKILRGDAVNSTRGTGDEKGNALGLQTCTKLIECNNGKLCIESKEGEGTKFTVAFEQN
ncbi:MAG TPA: hypothetical protein ENJ95_14335 [Bacteroidetes bacterium]|nr:hypothetical protein [Bacteroidota bacterium]